MTDTATTIYTKTGDDGTTGRLFGGRLAKQDLLVEACGDIDEAVAALGVARAALTDEAGAGSRESTFDLAEVVLRVQRDLFVVAANLNANPRAEHRLVPGISQVTPQMTDEVERLIDRLVEARPLRPVFVVPGTTQASAALDLARAVLRRAERHVVGVRAAGRTVPAEVIAYLNRAGDLLYILARHAVDGREEPVSHV